MANVAGTGLTYSYTAKQGEGTKLELGSTATGLVRGAQCTVLITKGAVNALAEGMYEP